MKGGIHTLPHPKFSFAGGSHPGPAPAPSALNTNWCHPADQSGCADRFHVGIEPLGCTVVADLRPKKSRTQHWPVTNSDSQHLDLLDFSSEASHQTKPVHKSSIKTMSEGGQLPWKVQKIDQSRGPGELYVLV